MKQDGLHGALAELQCLDEVRELPQDDAHRIDEQPRLVSRFYDVVTTFYEFAWGATFHFSPRRPRESLAASQRRHDEGIGQRLRRRTGMNVADIGCGIGGPIVSIAQATGANITGINFNARQIRRGEDRLRRAGLSNSCQILYADYMNVPLRDGTFDALYAFEALCHAPNKRLAFQELNRLLKPGAEAAIVEWCLTDSFDPGNGQHNEVRAHIEKANATPELPTAEEYIDAMRNSGFEVIEAVDQQAEQGHPATPWYMALQGRDLSLSSLARIPAGRALTGLVTRVLERAKLAPAGTSEASRLLNVAADALVEGGELGIFTPSFLIHARKPEQPQESATELQDD